MLSLTALIVKFVNNSRVLGNYEETFKWKYLLNYIKTLWKASSSNELCFSIKQCFWSGSKWIRVDFWLSWILTRIGVVLRIRIKKKKKQGYGPKLTNKPDFQPSKKALYPRRYVFWPIIYIKCLYFSCKKFNILWRLSLTRIRIRIGLATWIRIWICIEEKAGSGSALKPMRIHSTTIKAC